MIGELALYLLQCRTVKIRRRPRSSGFRDLTIDLDAHIDEPAANAQ